MTKGEWQILQLDKIITLLRKAYNPHPPFFFLAELQLCLVNNFMCEAHKSPSNTHWTVESPGRLDVSHRRNHIISGSRKAKCCWNISISCYHGFLKSPLYAVGPLSGVKDSWVDKGLQDQAFWHDRETITNPWNAVLLRWLSLWLLLFIYNKFIAGTELSNTYRADLKKTLSATWTLLRCSLCPKPLRWFVVWLHWFHAMRSSHVLFSWEGSTGGRAGHTEPS